MRTSSSPIPMRPRSAVRMSKRSPDGMKWNPGILPGFRYASSGLPLLFHRSFRRLHGIRHQHGDGHGADTARQGREVTCHFPRAVEIQQAYPDGMKWNPGILPGFRYASSGLPLPRGHEAIAHFRGNEGCGRGNHARRSGQGGAAGEPDVAIFAVVLAKSYNKQFDSGLPISVSVSGGFFQIIAIAGLLKIKKEVAMKNDNSGRRK